MDDISGACCPSCGGQAFDVFAAGLEDRFEGMPGRWDLLDCRECRLVYTYPQYDPKSVDPYPADYHAYFSPRSLRKSALGRAAFRLATLPYRIRFGEPGWHEVRFGGGRLLEIGCGSGVFMEKMACMGWKCWGVDRSAAAVEKARRRVPGAVLIEGTLADVPGEEKFDLIVMYHVLEHMKRPSEILGKCRDMLEAAGILYIGVPNLGGMESKVFSRFWSGLDVPRHSLHFREDILVAMIERAGFHVISRRPSLFVSSISESLILMLPRMLRRYFIKSWPARLLYLTCFFPAVLSYFFGNRGCIELLARRKMDGSKDG